MAADLKTDQISAWLESQKTNALSLSYGPAMALSVEQWKLSGSITDSELLRTQQRLQSIVHANDYVDATIVSRDGEVLTSTQGNARLCLPEQSHFDRVLESREAVFTMIHGDNCVSDPRLSLGLLVPMTAVDSKGKRVVAVLVLRIDPERSLFPLVRTWPTPSLTAETVLLEYRNQEVVPLSQMGRRSDALRVERTPITATEQLAVQAIRGERSLLEGFDAFAVPVLGTGRKLPAPGWILLVKQDRAELYQSLWPRTLLTSLLTLVFTLLGSWTVWSWTRQRAEQKILENQRFLRTIADSMPGMVGYWTADLRCTFANPEYLASFDGTPTAAIGGHIEQLLGAERFRESERFVRAALAGDAQRFERILQGQDGGRLYQWVHYVPDLSDGVVRGFFVLTSDITELKEAQRQLEVLNRELEERTHQAEQASHAKSEFLANMSHEIRTPLNAIVGLSHLIQDTGLDEKQHDYANRIHEASELLLGILNDILDISKIEAGKLHVERTSFELGRVMGSVMDLVSERARDKGLDAHFIVPKERLGCLIGDPLRLTQVLLNLTSNAVKFTEHGAITVEVAVERHCEQRLTLRFSVTDTGIGIPAEAIPRLFQPFSQADSSTTRRFGGSGLGLVISKRLVELMGGTLSVDSVPGHGSVFSFTLSFGVQTELPANERATEGQNATSEPRLRVSERPSGAPCKRILLAEDNETNRIVVGDMLEIDGYHVDYACNGREVVEKALAADAAYALILMDIQMPIWDGFEATRRIRQVDATVPIVAMTAHAMESERQRCLDAEMNDHIPKPFEPEVLRAKVAEWCRGQERDRTEDSELGPYRATIPRSERYFSSDVNSASALSSSSVKPSSSITK